MECPASVTTRPRVTIVTVNYNMRAGLEQTIKSVVDQTYPNLEYVVIDGGSTDGSVEVIQHHVADISHWISEKDRNLYDGMNKGVVAATGEWVLFMNSGDRFADKDAVADMFSQSHDGVDLLYGHVVWRYEGHNLDHLVLADSPEVLPERMNCSHQSLFARTSLLRERPFELNLLISDYDFLLGCLASGKQFKAIDRTVAVITKGGRSDVTRLLVLQQQQRVLARHDMLTWQRRLKYPLKAGILWFFLKLREGLPRPLARRLLARKLRRTFSTMASDR